MIDDNKLRGMIYEKHKSKGQFAESMGWSRQKLDWALKNPSKLKLGQVQEMIVALGLQGDPQAASIFLPIAFK